MATELLYCETLENELQAAIQACSFQGTTRKVESGLHNTPEKLTRRLQEELDRTAPEISRVLLGFAFCGNALAGVRTGNFELIIPRADDCITLLLGSYRRRMQIQNESAAYFLTEGWMKGEKNIWREYCHTVERYGEKRADAIFRMMLAHYHRLLVVDCGVSDMEKLRAQTEKVAAGLKLQHEIIPGTLDFLTRLLCGPWDEADFLVIPPQTEILRSDLTLHA